MSGETTKILGWKKQKILENVSKEENEKIGKNQKIQYIQDFTTNYWRRL